MPVPFAAYLLVAVKGVVLVESLVHPAVVERVLDLGVLHQMGHGLVRVARHKSLAESQMGMTHVIGVPFLGEHPESRVEIFSGPWFIFFLKTDLPKLIAADGPRLHVAGLLKLRQSLQQGLLRLIVPFHGDLRRRHLRQPHRRLVP